jgi:hypothetical protein
MLLSTMSFPDPSAAVAALQAVGARYEPRLDLATDVPGIGRIQRRFGVLRSPIGATGVADPAILEPFASALQQPENHGIVGRQLGYCPASKRLLIQIRPILFERRLHVPWTLRPMNMDFMSLASRANRAERFGFRTFYSEQVQIGAAPGHDIAVLQLFSFPLSGSPDQTLLEPDRDDELDASVGVILEANILPGPV